MPKTIKADWNSYFDKVLPKDAPPVQITETRRAFYAGAWAALNLMIEIGSDSVSEDAGILHIESLFQECRDFQARIGKDA